MTLNPHNCGNLTFISILWAKKCNRLNKKIICRLVSDENNCLHKPYLKEILFPMLCKTSELINLVYLTEVYFTYKLVFYPNTCRKVCTYVRNPFLNIQRFIIHQKIDLRFEKPCTALWLIQRRKQATAQISSIMHSAEMLTEDPQVLFLYLFEIKKTLAETHLISQPPGSPAGPAWCRSCLRSVRSSASSLALRCVWYLG